MRTFAVVLAIALASPSFADDMNRYGSATPGNAGTSTGPVNDDLRSDQAAPARDADSSVRRYKKRHRYDRYQGRPDSTPAPGLDQHGDPLTTPGPHDRAYEN